MSDAVISVEPFPTLKQEVDRKAMDALYGLAEKFEKKLITGSEFMVSLDTLFQGFSGIASGEFMHLLTQFAESIKKRDYKIIRLFNRPVLDDTTMAVILKPRLNRMDIFRLEGGKSPVISSKRFENTKEGDELMQTTFNKFCESLINAGFEEF